MARENDPQPGFIEGTRLEHHEIAVNGVTFHVVQAGPKDGPLVLLLHGFPEFWYGWRNQIPALTAAGYRVWAPDQRGYNHSDKPRRVADYALDRLGGDVIGLIEASGRSRVHLVGHDWGAMVAWWVAGHAPHLLKRLVVINVPHGEVMARTLRRDPRQLLRSWYTLFFQLPWLPETLLGLRNWALAARALERTSRPRTFAPDDIERYKEAWSQPGAMRSMVNWYRAALRGRAPRGRADRFPAAGFRAPCFPADRFPAAGFRAPCFPAARFPATRFPAAGSQVAERITVPTLLIWGAQDHALRRTMAQPSIDRCDDGHLVMIETATHWVQHEESVRVNALITQFLAGVP